MAKPLPAVNLDSFGEGELAELNDRTAHILRMRSGMWDGKRHRLSEVGKELGISADRVRVLEIEGLTVIRVVRESQRHLREEPVGSRRFRWRLPRAAVLRRRSASRESP